MTFFLGFICGVALGAMVTHLAHEYLDSMFPIKEEPPGPPLWMRNKEDKQ